MAPKAPDGNENVGRNSIWTNNKRLFADCYTFWLPFCVCCISFYYERLLASGNHVLPAQFSLEMGNFSFCRQLKMTKKFYKLSITLEGWGGGGNF